MVGVYIELLLYIFGKRYHRSMYLERNHRSIFGNESRMMCLEETRVEKYALIYPYHEVTPSKHPLRLDMSRITIDEAVGLMINLDYIPTDFTVLDMIEAFAKV